MPEKKLEQARAQVTRIIWRADTGPRVILKVKPTKGREFTAIGDMESPKMMQEYEFTGSWKSNPRYGSTDFHFITFRTILPNSNAGIYSYLVHTAKWIGPKTADELLEKFGNETLNVLKNEPAKASSIKGLTPERLRLITKSLRENEKMEAAAIEVGNMIGAELGTFTIQKVIKKWGANAAAIIKKNPHRLSEISGVGFLKSDALYKKLGGKPDALRRHLYAAHHVLTEQAAMNGHTLVSRMAFEAELKKLVGPINEKLFRAGSKGAFFSERGPMVCSGDLFDAESRVVNKILDLMNVECPEWTLDSIKKQEIRDAIAQLQDDQMKALELVMNNNVSIITGAPGTGKTFTIARVVSALQCTGGRVRLAAPTGKAAKQMELALSETVGLPARTIHSLLEPAMDENYNFVFTRTEMNPVECNVLVADEASMIDVRLARSLLRALPDNCKLIIVGDRYQLPSVGPGSVLRDLIAAGVPFCELSKIKRNAGKIVHACHAIKDGQSPIPSTKLDPNSGENWRHVECSSPIHAKTVIEKLISGKLAEYGIHPVWQTQIISPTNERGALSCKHLNNLVKSIVNPGGLNGKLDFAVGDKVVRCRNGEVDSIGNETICPKCQGSIDPDEMCPVCFDKGKVPSSQAKTRIVNGDIGVIKAIESSYIEVDFMFPDRSVKIPRAENYLKLAYCMTCHKMQGSEIDVVILPIMPDMMKMPMVTREWLYTAMSRAKKFIITVGNLGAMPIAISKVGNTKRITSMTEIMTKCQMKK